MSADKHTPGPWSVLVHEASTSVESKHYTVAADVTNADADLIAAAPDLLVACKMAVASIEHSDGGRYLEDEQALYALRCAIIKAEGCTP